MGGGCASVADMTEGPIRRDDGEAVLPTCSRCGTIHGKMTNAGMRPLCKAHSRTTGKPCSSWPVSGTVVCRLHGGSIPAVKKKAEQRRVLSLTQGKIAKLLEECDIPDRHPLDGLLDVVRMSGAWVRVLQGLVGELDVHPEDGTIYASEDGQFTKQVGLYGPDHLGDATPHVLFSLLGQWQDRHAKACKLALDANIDERLVRNAEATSERLFTAIGRAIDAAHLTPDQSRTMRLQLATELRTLVGPLS